MSEEQLQHPSFLTQGDVLKRTLEMLGRPVPSVKLPDWRIWNQITGGFRPKEYSLFCGATGAGKTQWMANVSAQLVKARTRHYVMSIETGAEDYMARVMSAFYGEDLNTGEMIPAAKLGELAARHQSDLFADVIRFSHYERRVPIEQLKYDLSYMLETEGCALVFIDNLNYMIGASDKPTLEMDRYTEELVTFIKTNPIHVFMCMHPKKPDKGRSLDDLRLETEFDIKGSSTAPQEAQNVLLFNRPKVKDVQDGARRPSDREITIRKMRRRGMNIGRTLVYECQVGVKYLERAVV